MAVARINRYFIPMFISVLAGHSFVSFGGWYYNWPIRKNRKLPDWYECNKKLNLKCLLTIVIPMKLANSEWNNLFSHFSKKLEYRQCSRILFPWTNFHEITLSYIFRVKRVSAFSLWNLYRIFYILHGLISSYLLRNIIQHRNEIATAASKETSKANNKLEMTGIGWIFNLSLVSEIRKICFDLYNVREKWFVRIMRK